MAKSKGNGYGKNTMLDASVFLSPAWLSLGQKGTAPCVSSCSPQVLVLLLAKRQFGKRKDKKGGNPAYERIDDNRFTLTYKELESFGISQQRATRAFDELLAKGFIKIVNPGGLYEKDKAAYALVDDFRLWRPGNPPIRTRERDVKRGFQGKGLGAAGGGSKNIAHVNGGHPHTRQQGTGKKKTHTPTRDTQKSEIFADSH